MIRFLSGRSSFVNSRWSHSKTIKKIPHMLLMFASLVNIQRISRKCFSLQYGACIQMRNRGSLRWLEVEIISLMRKMFRITSFTSPFALAYVICINAYIFKHHPRISRPTFELHAITGDYIRNYSRFRCWSLHLCRSYLHALYKQS